MVAGRGRIYRDQCDRPSTNTHSISWPSLSAQAVNADAAVCKLSLAAANSMGFATTCELALSVVRCDLSNAVACRGRQQPMV